MIAYQPVDPACGVPATRIPLADVVGLFLCRRSRPSFGPAALMDIIGEFRTVMCRCGTHFDVQVLSIEKITPETAELVRSGQCPSCRRAHASQLQLQRNGLMLSREADGWFIWVSRVMPNRLGNAMEEHLFWYQLDWSKRNAQLAEELNLPDDLIGEWRRKVARSKSPSKPKPRANRRASNQVSRRRGSGANA